MKDRNKNRMKDGTCCVCNRSGMECCVSATCGGRAVCLSCHLSSQTGERYAGARVWRPEAAVAVAPVVTVDEARAESWFAGISD